MNKHFNSIKIAIISPRSEFSLHHQEKLSKLGTVIYAQTREELPLDKLLQMAKGATALGIDPYPLGGFEKEKKL